MIFFVLFWNTNDKQKSKYLQIDLGLCITETIRSITQILYQSITKFIWLSMICILYIINLFGVKSLSYIKMSLVLKCLY